MEKISKKLKSERGVTILLALLLFLVCAVTGSVVITAGTAASGTLSERAKLDQRYFSVTSAAELLRNKFDNKRVRISKADNSAAEIWSDNGWIDNSSPNIRDEEKFVIRQSQRLKNPVGEPAVYSYSLTANTGDSERDGKLKVNITVTEKTSGLIFELENANDDDEKKFRLQMEYSAAPEIGLDFTTYRWQIVKVSLGD